MTIPVFFRIVVTSAALSLLVAGCSKEMHTGSIPKAATGEQSADALTRQAENLSIRYRRNQKDPALAVAFASSLEGLGRNSDALRVLENTLQHAPDDGPLLSAYGRAMLRDGRPTDALPVLQKAETAGERSTALYSARGAALDQLGRHDEARQNYQRALQLKPNDPGTLANLGLSYALSKDLKQAEAVLRKAAAQPGATVQVRQNLALVLGLEGRFDEAEKISRQDLSADQAKDNSAYLRQMMSQSNSWQKLKSLDG